MCEKPRPRAPVDSYAPPPNQQVGLQAAPVIDEQAPPVNDDQATPVIDEQDPPVNDEQAPLVNVAQLVQQLQQEVDALDPGESSIEAGRRHIWPALFWG